MNDLNSIVERLKSQIKGGLIVSCQAPSNSPLCTPEIIAAMAQTAELNAARAVRIDSPAHIAEVKRAVQIPIFGIYKIITEQSEVYITPTVESAQKVAAAGASIIAVDATLRMRPNNETLKDLVFEIQQNLRLPVMADVATLAEGIHAAEELGCDFISTTLSGYTSETAHLIGAPDFELVEKLSRRVKTPVICEGRLRTPEDARRALDCGAFSIVVGKAVTGIDTLISDFVFVVN
jgi:N-acylglucosamine-6-phosphate 2-epimerase